MDSAWFYFMWAEQKRHLSKPISVSRSPASDNGTKERVVSLGKGFRACLTFKDSQGQNGSLGKKD